MCDEANPTPRALIPGDDRYLRPAGGPSLKRPLLGISHPQDPAFGFLMEPGTGFRQDPVTGDVFWRRKGVDKYNMDEGGGGSLTVQEEGVSTGDPRPSLNFVGAAIIAADDAGNDRVNVTLSQSPASASVVGTGRTLSAGTGLTGGGDLTIDRTLSLSVPVALDHGGTGADLSATGGTGQFLRQSSTGAAVTVSAIGHADLGAGGGSGSKYLRDDMTWQPLDAVSGRGNGAANRLAYWSDANTLTSDGDLLFDGTNMALGLAIDSNIRLAVGYQPADPASAPTGLRVTCSPSYGSNTAHTLRGHYGYLSISSAVDYTSGSLSSGIYGQYNYAAASGTYTIAAGMYGIATHNGGGTVTTLMGLAGQLQHLGTGGGQNAYALWAGSPSASGSGNYTNGVGLHVADQSVARYTTSHAIRVADQGSGAGTTWALGIVGTDDQSYIAGSLMIGVASAAPARKLEVRSTSAQQRWSYDASNYAEIAVSSAGAVTLTATGASDGFCIGDSSDNIGFYGVTTVARPAAYTQTYSTADRTLSAYTPDSESVAYTGAVDGEAKLADLNALRVAYENLRAFIEDLAQMVNSVTDDLQAVGLLQ